MSLVRSRWAAIGAAVAVTLGIGGIKLVSATNPDGASTLVTITPCRLADTRAGADNVGPRNTPLGAADTLVVNAHGDAGDCTIPATATALSVNVTPIGATQLTFLTVWRTGAAQPLASSVNPAPGQPPTPNAVTTALSAGGQFSVFNLVGAVDVIIDVNGYYVEHDHDDRYYTKQQADALRNGIDADGRIALGPADFSPTNFIPEAFGGPSNWTRSTYLTHLGPSLVECVIAPVDLPPDRTVSSVHVIHTAAAGATVDGALVGAKSVAGSSADAIDERTLTTGVFPATPAGQLADGTMNVVAPAPVTAGYDYGLRLCTDAQISITGVSIQLD